jgi:hypothetical protein
MELKMHIYHCSMFTQSCEQPFPSLPHPFLAPVVRVFSKAPYFIYCVSSEDILSNGGEKPLSRNVNMLDNQRLLERSVRYAQKPRKHVHAFNQPNRTSSHQTGPNATVLCTLLPPSETRIRGADPPKPYSQASLLQRHPPAAGSSQNSVSRPCAAAGARACTPGC